MSCSHCVRRVLDIDELTGQKRCHFCGQPEGEEAVPPLPDTKPGFHLNRSRSAVVADNVYWLPMKDCPRGAKVFLLGAGHSATVGEHDGSDFWVGWFPLPKIPKELL